MTSPPGFSAQTLSVLAALCDEPSRWRRRRHLYRLTAAGVASAPVALASAVRPAATKARTAAVRGSVVGVVP